MPCWWVGWWLWRGLYLARHLFTLFSILKLITLGKPEKCFLTFVPTTNVTEQHLRRWSWGESGGEPPFWPINGAAILDLRDWVIFDFAIIFVLPFIQVWTTNTWRSTTQIILRIQLLTVNHTNNFKDPITGVHTNGIEGRYWKQYLFIVHSSILSFKVVLYKEEASKEWQLWSWIVSKALATLSSFLSMTTKYTYVALPHLTQ